MDKSFALRWETAQRYYAAYLHRDLWGEVVLTRAWGGRGSRLGSVHTDHLQPDQVDAVLAGSGKTPGAAQIPAGERRNRVCS